MDSRSTHEAYLANKYFPNLDWLRAIAILGVILHHVPRSTLPGMDVVQANGRLGVDLFFVISGVLIATLLLREKDKFGSINVPKFYMRRTLRLFPLYYAMLGIYVVLIYGLNQYSPENQALFKQKLPYHLFYLSNITAAATTGPFFFAWSLAVEEQFYLFFSQLMRWLRSRTVLAVILVMLAAKVVAINTGLVTQPELPWRIIFSYMESVLLGVVAAFVLNSPQGFKAAQRLSHPAVLWPMAALTVGLLCFHEFKNKSGLDAQVLFILFTLIITAFTVMDKTPYLGNKLFLHIGKISYGIYLTHMLVIMAVTRAVSGNGLICFAVATPLVIITASIIYRYFESPILEVKKRFSRM